MAQASRKIKSRCVSNQRNRDLAKIHIAKKQLGMDDTVYREMLQNLTEVSSAAQLDQQGLQKVLTHLKACGFKPMHKSTKKSGMHKAPPWERAPQLSKIGALLADMGLPWQYADGISKRMYGVDRVRWLYPNQLRGIIAALVKRQKKLMGKQNEQAGQ